MKYITLRDSTVVSTADFILEKAIEHEQGLVLTPNETAHINAQGEVRIENTGTPAPQGFSDVRVGFAIGSIPDGKGGWALPPPVPAPNVSSMLNWKLSAALAAKGVSFNPTDPTIAARWQYEPSFAIDGVVAKALQASLGYDASQLQALFNEAAALK